MIRQDRKSRKRRSALSWSVIGLFSLSFTIATSFFYNSIPTNDYLMWVYSDYNSKWPQTLWVPYNQHRLVIAKLVVWTDAYILHGAFWRVAVLTEILVFLILLLLLQQISRRLVDAEARVMAFAALCLCLLRGQEIALVRYPSNINHVLVVFFFVVGMSIIFSQWGSRNRNLALIAVCAAATATVLSAANGLVALPIFVVLFFYNFRWLVGSTVLGLFCGALLAIYLIGDHTKVVPSWDINSFWTIITFVINYIGAPWKIGPLDLSNGTYVGSALTIVVGSIYFWRLVSGQVPGGSLDAFALGIMMFVTGSGCFVALGRAGLGLVQARSGRFFTETELLQCSTVVLLLILLFESSWRGITKKLTLPLLVIIATLMLPDQIKEFDDSIKDHILLNQIRLRLLANPYDAQALSILTPNKNDAQKFLVLMERDKIYGFHSRSQ